MSSTFLPHPPSGEPFRIEPDAPFSATDAPTRHPVPDSKQILAANVDRIAEAQRKLYADNRFSILLVFQAVDAAGKDSTIRKVLSGVNPAGCQVFSFKQPSAEELDHDFLWRTAKRLPERGRIGVFNRSYYEEALVVRVHPEYLGGQRIPGVDPANLSDDFWEQRFRSIRDHEEHLARNGTVILKFWLRVSRLEQAHRLLRRLERPEKTGSSRPAISQRGSSGTSTPRPTRTCYRRRRAPGLPGTRSPLTTRRTCGPSSAPSSPRPSKPYLCDGPRSGPNSGKGTRCTERRCAQRSARSARTRTTTESTPSRSV